MNLLLLEFLYIYILYIYSIMLWSLRHGGGSYPILSRESDYELMCFLMHVCNITKIADLKEWGVRPVTIKCYFARELRNYKEAHPEIPKERRHWSIESLSRSKKARDERLQRELIRDEVNKRSYLKLDEAIRARAECVKSVMDYYLRRQ